MHDLTDRTAPVVSAYLEAHAARDVDAALGAFTPTAVVTDDGRTYRGTQEVRAFLSRAGAEFTYTTTLVSAERTDASGWVAVQRLEGDFPGGEAVLRYRFTLDGDRIAVLVVAP
ncbi:MAG: nuclear transport factor 2 family protein [Kineosporiaceae bacterium]